MNRLDNDAVRVAEITSRTNIKITTITGIFGLITILLTCLTGIITHKLTSNYKEQVISSVEQELSSVNEVIDVLESDNIKLKDEQKDEYDRGYSDGLGIGADKQKEEYNKGYAEGSTTGYQEGYDIGYSDGYNEGIKSVDTPTNTSAEVLNTQSPP